MHYTRKATIVAGLLTLAASLSACSAINLSALNPFDNGQDESLIPEGADQVAASATYLGPAPSDTTFQPGTISGGGFGSTTTTTTTTVGGGGFSQVAPGSDPRPLDPTQAAAYDMMVARGQATCQVPVLITGFQRITGGYNGNVVCPGIDGSGGLATPYNSAGLWQQ